MSTLLHFTKGVANAFGYTSAILKSIAWTEEAIYMPNLTFDRKIINYDFLFISVNRRQDRF